MCFEISDLKNLKLAILRFLARIPHLSIQLYSSKNIFIVKAPFIIYIFFQFIIKSQKLPAMVLAWENLQEVFVMLLVIFILLLFVVFLHSHFLLDIIPHPSVDYYQDFRPILYFQPSPSQSDSPHFHFQPFLYLLTARATVLSKHFLPTGVFYFTLLPDISRLFLEAGSYSLKFAGLHTDP